MSFTKQDIIPEYVKGGEEAQEWAPDANDYRLLCPKGGCRPVDEYADCNVAKVPARAGRTTLPAMYAVMRQSVYLLK